MRGRLAQCVRASVSLLRNGIRRLQFAGRSPPLLGRVMAAMLFLPLFMLLLALVWLYGRLCGPLDFECTTRGGERMRCLLPDAVQMCVWLFGVWEPDITTFVEGRLRPGDAFVDVGAHAGYYTLMASRLVGPTGRVAAIEASPRIFGLLSASLALNESSNNVRASQVAATSKPGTLDVFGAPAWNLGWTSTLASRGFPLEATVAAAPLEAILTAEEIETARLIKIDVEGNEAEVVAGMQQAVRSCRPDVELLIELSPRWWPDREMRPEQVLQPFFDAGFFAYRIDNNYAPWRYLWPASVRRPRRVRGPIASRIGQVDLVLSRVDADEL